MSAYIENRVEKPTFFKVGPLRSGRGRREPYVIGFDSEADTRTGAPMLLQFSLPEHRSEQETILIEIPEGHREYALGQLLAFVAEYCTRKDREYVIYGWNLEYEFTQLFGHFDDDVKSEGELELTITLDDRLTGQKHEYQIDVMNDKRHLAKITNLSTKRQVRLLDGMSYYKASLNAAAKMLQLGEKFYDDSFDVRHVTRDDLTNPEFLRYARQDAWITRKVGEQIIDMHETYDVTTCISAPHFAAKVFRHRFLTTEIKLPEPVLEQAGLWSYHGGKNGFYLDGPSLIPNAYQYDITSAYPEAMRQLPDPERSEWHTADRYAPGQHAIVRVTLQYRRCEYRGFMQFDGHWPDTGYIEDVYITSYELDAMMERGEVDILSYHAWVMTGPTGGPLVRYVDEFFSMKVTAEGPKRETAKLFLNSLYGKFFQKVALGTVGALNLDTGEWITTDPDEPYDWRAGGLYHPPIASLITGFVRARIHRMEHRYHSLMTSTDGIFATEPPVASDLGKHLGGLTVKRGELRIWRERLYVFRPDDGSEIKAAFHGYRGRDDDPTRSPMDNMVAALERIPLRHGTYTYEGRQMVTLHLSTVGLRGERYEPGRFVTLPYTIEI